MPQSIVYLTLLLVHSGPSLDSCGRKKNPFPAPETCRSWNIEGETADILMVAVFLLAKTPVPLIMKELMLTVVWEIIPLEKEHFSGMTYALCIWSIQHHVCSLLWGGLLRCDLLLSWGDVVHIKDVMHLSGGRRSRVSGTGWVVLVGTPHQQAAHLKPSEFSLCNFCWFLGPGETWEASAIDGMVTTKFITFPELLWSSNSLYVHNISCSHAKQQS